MKRLLFSLALAVANASLAFAQPAPTSPGSLAATCANCHGTNGVSVGELDGLAGMNKDELVRKMQDFKTGKKPATIMHQLSKGYTDAQIDAVAAWFAAQKPAK